MQTYICIFFKSEVQKLFTTKQDKLKLFNLKKYQILPHWVGKANKITRSLLYTFKMNI